MRVLLVNVIAMALCGCGQQVTLPPVEASSPHFHYFAMSQAEIPLGILDRLEQHRADMLGYLGLTESGIVTYYRFDRIVDLNRIDCSGSVGAACTDGSTVYTTNVFEQHELIHAYLSAWTPPQLIAEGTAEAFHCGEPLRDWVFATPLKTAWDAVVAQPDSDRDVYRWGVRLVLHLIRTYGVAPFVKYYQTAHLTDDPALFALEFERFWGQPIDAVWAVLAGNINATPLPICPCGLPVVPTDGGVMPLSAFDDYRVLPPPQDGQTLVMQLVGNAPKLMRCEGGAAMPMRGISATGAPSVQPAIAALVTDQDRYFVSFDGASSVAGQWQPLIASDCSVAGLLSVSLQTDYVAVGVPRRTDGAVWYIELSFAGQATISREDAGPITMYSCQACNFNCSIQSQYEYGIAQERVLGLTLPSTATGNNMGITITAQWYAAAP
jgi:hypothetical protein